MTKRIVAILLTAAIAAATITACGKTAESPETTALDIKQKCTGFFGVPLARADCNSFFIFCIRADTGKSAVVLFSIDLAARFYSVKDFS